MIEEILSGLGTSLFLAAPLMASRTESDSDVSRSSKEAVSAMLDKGDVTIIDVRTESAWNDGNTKIEGAHREDPKNTDSWADKYGRDDKLVL